MTFEHLRHKQPSPLAAPRELVIACAPMNSNINLSRIVRAAGCCGVSTIIAAGRAKLDAKIARDGAETVEIIARRTLPPALKEWKAKGWRIVGLEQTTHSQSLYEYVFPAKTVLVVGNERQGLTPEELASLDDVVEIPVYGLPHAHNAATAAAIAMYEYCRQQKEG